MKNVENQNTQKNENKVNVENINREEKKLQEFEDRLKRMQADFENLKKITDRQIIDAVCYANEELIKKMLHILDSFDSALKNIKNEQDKAGVLMIKEQISKVLKEAGLCEVDMHGKKFNPDICEALMAEESDKDEDTVLDVLQKGYTFKNKVIRHAKVKIAKSKKIGGK